MAFTTHRPRKPTMLSSTSLLSLVLLSVFLLILLRSPSLPPCSPPATSRETHPWSGDLREVDFSWNSLKLTGHRSPPATLRIAVFSRKWPVFWEVAKEKTVSRKSPRWRLPRSRQGKDLGDF